MVTRSGRSASVRRGNGPHDDVEPGRELRDGRIDINDEPAGSANRRLAMFLATTRMKLLLGGHIVSYMASRRSRGHDARFVDSWLSCPA